MEIIVVLVMFLVGISVYTLLTFLDSRNVTKHEERLQSIRQTINTSARMQTFEQREIGPDGQVRPVGASAMDYKEIANYKPANLYKISRKKVILALICGAIGATFFLGYMMTKDIETDMLLVFGICLYSIVAYIPRLMYFQHRTIIREQVAHTFPNAVDLLNVCLQAGIGFDQSLFRVAVEIQEMAPLLSDEFIRVYQEINAGKTRKDALTDMAIRLDVDEVTSVTTNIIQAERLGGSLVGSLRVQSETLRDKLRQKMRAKIARVPVKLIFPMVFFLIPSIVLLIIGPAAVSIYKNFIIL